MEAKFCGKCGTPVDERGLCPKCNPTPIVASFCGKCGGTLNENGVCSACAPDRVGADVTPPQTLTKKESKKKILIIIVALVLVVSLALTTVFVVLPMFNKKEENKVYTSGVGGVAFKSSFSTFFTSAAGLCYADEDKEVSLLHFNNVDSGELEPIQSYHGDNMVCIDDKVYLSQGEIYEIDIADDNTCKSDVWLSYEDMDKNNIDVGKYDYLEKESFLSHPENLQYNDGYIYYSRGVNADKVVYGQQAERVGTLNIIGRINIETKNMEILRIIEPSDYSDAFDYVIYDEWIYYNCGYYDNMTLRKCRLDGSDDQSLYEGYSYNLNIYNDKLYFLGESINQISSMNLDGSDRKTLVDAGEYIPVFTIDSEGNAIYYKTGDSVYKISLDDLSVSKVMSVCGRPYYMTCVDSKLYMSLSMPIYPYSEKRGGITEQCGTKDKPLLTGLCYDTERKTARVAYTYLDGDTIFTGTQRYFWKNYSGEEYGLYQAINSSVIFEIYK
ncbi:MAG: DUF5050 domain-containing protein [Ruminococcaceae bacterium]|nr:DUF5050 domain-containing protein [Oscillospiraceae bacterium]